MPRAVLFDLFETLITESRTRPVAASGLALELGCEPEAFRTLWKARRSDVEMGRSSLRQALVEIGTELGHPPEEPTLRRLCEARIRAKAAPFEEIEPEVLRVVGLLRGRGLRLGVVSNCFAEDVGAWPRCALARHFDCAVFSFEVGLAKPDPRIYQEATRRIGVDTADTCFVGDGMHDELFGAEHAGIRAFRALWFLRRWPNFRDEPGSFVSLAAVEDVLGLVEHSTGPLTVCT